MAYIRLNENPFGLNTGDCVIRAISTALNYNWFMVHDELSFLSRKMADMPSSNRVWKKYLYDLGFEETPIINTCPDCLTVEEFAYNHPKGRYILSTCEYKKAEEGIFVTGSHVIALIDGNWYDTWDSGGDVPLSFFIVSKGD